MRASALHFSTTKLLASLILLLIALPILEDVRYGEPIIAALMACVVLSAVFALGGRRRAIAVTIALVIPAIVGVWLDESRPYLIPRSLIALLGMLFVAYVMLHLLRFVVYAPKVTIDVLSAAISAYLLLGMFWAFTYTITDNLSPGSFTISGGTSQPNPIRGFNAFYFSFSTLTTDTYGDILPKSKIARTLAMAEGISSMFYMAILISRLVSQFSFGNVAREEIDDDKMTRLPS